MDNIDKQIKIKKFFKTIYRDIEPEEYIRVFQNNAKRSIDSTYSKVQFFNDIDKLVTYASNKYLYTNNTYFELATTNGTSGEEEQLVNRYCLAFDFDKKDLGVDFSHKDIINLFKGIKIYCHCIVDSGNGYHAYVIINKTNDFNKVEEVQKVLCDKLGADKNAIKPTQILRIPYTYNIKDKAKMVTIIHLVDRHSNQFRPYDIDFLYEKNCNKRDVCDSKTIEYVLDNTNIPKCIEIILNNGSQVGNRNKDLNNIVVSLRLRNRKLGEIKQIAKEWAYKSDFDDNLDYRIDYAYNNKRSLELECNTCLNKDKCYSSIVSDFDYRQGYSVLEFEEKLGRKLVNSKRVISSKKRGVNSMQSNKLLVINVLKNNSDGLYKSELIKAMSYKKKCALSEPTLIKVLKALEEEKIITIEKANRTNGVESFYKINDIKSNVDTTLKISYLATSMCIIGAITTNELRLYHIMRRLHNKQLLEGKATGNLFTFKQTDLAKEMDTDQKNISVMIDNLLEVHILDIWYRNKSKNNGFDYYTYRLNC